MSGLSIFYWYFNGYLIALFLLCISMLELESSYRRNLFRCLILCFLAIPYPLYLLYIINRILSKLLDAIERKSDNKNDN